MEKVHLNMETDLKNSKFKAMLTKMNFDINQKAKVDHLETGQIISND
jgi:hypothetical protein